MSTSRRPFSTRRSKLVHIALLRGINVGRAKRISMGDLRSLVEDLGFSDVTTILNSGNIVFSAASGGAQESADRIEKALVAKLGVSSRITGLETSELEEIIESNPIAAATSQPSRFLVAVARTRDDLSALKPLAKQDWGAEVLAIGDRAAYLWCPDGILAGKLIDAAAKALGDRATTRNWATMNRILTIATSS